ncbi:ParA family protein [Halobacillus sp. H74]|uniref:ParA family protein n=1 Tax=Halobacillus sp. H74 TaxID=3457436 RepID=UPI003FCDED73
MAKVITFGIQKGGVGKTTTTGIIGYLMAQEGYRVLVVDMDSQGNVTDLLTQVDPVEIEGETVLEAIKAGDAFPYILSTEMDNLHVIPADDYLATLAGFLYRGYSGRPTDALNNILEPLKSHYDFILLDTPPSLGEQMTNSICASDWVVVLAESSKWAYTAIPRFIDVVDYAQEKVNPKVKTAGILRTMTDGRRIDSKEFVKLISDEYSDLIFDTIIKRKATTGRLAVGGLFNNKELSSAIKEYKEFYEELKKRMGV